MKEIELIKSTNFKHQIFDFPKKKNQYKKIFSDIKNDSDIQKNINIRN